MTVPQDPDPTMPVSPAGPPTGGEPTMPVTAGAGDPTIAAQPGYGGTGGGGPHEPQDYDGEDDDRRKLWLIAGGVLVLGVIVGVIIALLASGGGNDTASTTTTSSSSTTSSSTTTSSLPTTTTTPPPTTPAAPQVLQYTVSQNPVSCPATSQVTLTWATQSAQSVTISIDNPNGPYGTYGPSGQQLVPFACGGGPNPTQHIYYLQANGSGSQKANRQIQVTGNFPPATTTSTSGP